MLENWKSNIAGFDGETIERQRSEMRKHLILLPLLATLGVGCSDGQATAQNESAKTVPIVRVTGPNIPLTGRVTDAANVFSAEQRTNLSSKLEQFERATGHQMVVVTVPTLNGLDVATYTRNLANSWGIGRKQYNDGVVLLVAPNEHKARIAVGLGLEKTLPDALCQRIMDEMIIPRFRAGDLPGGINAGVAALIQRLS